MHKQRIYLDTSVIGGCFDKEFAEWSNKEFDCVKYQRDVRDKFISEAGGNFEQL